MGELITSSDRLRRLVADGLAAGITRYALDTEFHRERTYHPQVALVQLSWAGDTWLIDPLETDLALMVPLLESGGTCVLHAASQDLEVLLHSTGSLPTAIFDTQIAAAFVGLSSASLATVVERFAGVRLTKGDRMTDWLRRPLTAGQLEYAAQDVDHLLLVADRLTEELIRRDRLDWANAEFDQVLADASERRSPLETLRRIKEARSLKGRGRAIALALVEWREGEAAQRDVPVRTVMSDIALTGVARREPTTSDELGQIRGVDGRVTRRDVAECVLSVVAASRDDPPPPRLMPKGSSLDPKLRPVVSLVTSWVSQIARDHDLDPGVLATRADVESFLTDGHESRLDTGWRNAIVGGPIAALVGGRAAIAFDGDGGLVMEQRSHDRIT